MLICKILQETACFGSNEMQAIGEVSFDEWLASLPQIHFQSQESQIVILIIVFIFYGSSAQQLSTSPWPPVLQVLRLVFYGERFSTPHPTPSWSIRSHIYDLRGRVPQQFSQVLGSTES